MLEDGSKLSDRNKWRQTQLTWFTFRYNFYCVHACVYNSITDCQSFYIQLYIDYTLTVSVYCIESVVRVAAKGLKMEISLGFNLAYLHIYGHEYALSLKNQEEEEALDECLCECANGSHC